MQVSTYVDDVVSGKSVPDSKVGRFLAGAIAAIPRLEPEVLETLFNDNMQDVLLVSYLTNLTATQVTLLLLSLNVVDKQNTTFFFSKKKKEKTKPDSFADRSMSALLCILLLQIALADKIGTPMEQGWS